MARLGTQAVGETAPVGAVVGLLKPASQAGVGEILVVRRQAVVGRGLAIRLRGPIEGALTGSGSGDGCGDVSTEVSGGSCAHGVRLGCHAIVERKCTPLLEAPVDAHLQSVGHAVVGLVPSAVLEQGQGHREQLGVGGRERSHRGGHEQSCLPVAANHGAWRCGLVLELGSEVGVGASEIRLGHGFHLWSDHLHDTRRRVGRLAVVMAALSKVLHSVGARHDFVVGVAVAAERLGLAAGDVAIRVTGRAWVAQLVAEVRKRLGREPQRVRNLMRRDGDLALLLRGFGLDKIGAPVGVSNSGPVELIHLAPGRVGNRASSRVAQPSSGLGRRHQDEVGVRHTGST
mmetsp:Transcript_15036/g.31371  ORF Transcript_15036/g.31371 Transcript_15036/m.31371 type:complete len:344 (-) Transcript_15036:415-1446(-)